MCLLPSIYFLWGRIFRSLSLLKSTVILIFFNLKNFHIIWAHQKCESSDLSFFNFAFAILGLPAIPCEFDDQLFYVCKKGVEICLKLHWICPHFHSLTSQSFVFWSMNTGCHSLYLDILNSFHPFFIVFNVQVFHILA